MDWLIEHIESDAFATLLDGLGSQDGSDLVSLRLLNRPSLED